MRTTTVVILVLVGGCAGPRAHPEALVPSLRAPDDAAVRRQLAGHLERVRECLPVGRSGLVEVELTVEPDGGVGGARVARDSTGIRSVAPCMRQRMAALRFDPPPSRPLRFEHRFTACAIGGDHACELGPVFDGDGRPVRPALAEAFRALQDERAPCLAKHPEARAIVEVELTLDGAGKVTSGWVRRVLPAGSPLRECAVAPLLGSVIDGARARTLRATLGVGLGLPASTETFTARR